VLKKLQLKFICVIMGVVTVMLCILLGLVIFFMSQGLEHQSIRMMQSFSQEAFLPTPPPRELDGSARVPFFSVELGQHGQLLKTGGNYWDTADEETILQIVQAAQDNHNQTGKLEEWGLRFYKNIRPARQTIVFADMSAERAVMANLVRNCVLLGLVSFGLFLGFSVLLVRWMVRPVEEAWQQQKQFVADASHELKTPLTVIMTNAELLQNHADSEQEYRQFSDSILTMSWHMRGLVEGLLELARVDNGAVKTGYGELELSVLVSDGILPFEPLFFEKDLTLCSAVEPGVVLRGSAQHLRQVLDILLDNAMKYSSPGGEVWVRLRRQSGGCLLSVSSPGQALSREEQRDIFKRFYRVDKARSRDGSFGLGLSIAQRIVEEHQGKIWAESANGINTFFVQLPQG